MRKIAGVITTFARPEYYKQALKSLENCKGVNDGIDWYILQDGLDELPTDEFPRYKGINQTDWDKCYMLSLDTSLNVVQSNTERLNRGINFQMNRAFHLFNKGYDTLFIFEDDLVVSPYYIELLKACSSKRRNISVTFHSVTKHKVNIPQDLDLLRPAKRPRFWGFYLTREVWDKIKHEWYTFYNNDKPRFPFYDPIITQAIRKHTNGKYEPVVSRSYNVGINGTLTMSEDNWGERGLYDQSDKYIFNEDMKLKKFKLQKG